MEDQYQRTGTNTDVERAPGEAELLARNAELATLEPVGGGLLSMEEIVQAVRESRGEWGSDTTTKLDEIANYYENHDTSAEMESGHWETSPPEPDPMITTSLRLPKSLLDRVREHASTEDMKATAWIRAAVESKLAEPQEDSTETRLRRLESVVFSKSA